MINLKIIELHKNKKGKHLNQWWWYNLPFLLVIGCSIWKHAFISLCKFQSVAFAADLNTLLTTWRLQLIILIEPMRFLDSLSFIKQWKNFQLTLGQFIDDCSKFFMLTIDVSSSILFSKSLLVVWPETLNPSSKLVILGLGITVANDNIHFTWPYNRGKTFIKQNYETISQNCSAAALLPNMAQKQSEMSLLEL